MCECDRDIKAEGPKGSSLNYVRLFWGKYTKFIRCLTRREGAVR